MAPWPAVLLFPARPGEAAGALAGCRATALVAPAPPLLLFLFLAARGCRAADAAVTAAGLLLLVLGLGAGGALASAVARRILPGAPGRGLHVHLVFAAWAMLLLVVALFVTGSALASGLAVLVWGVVAGTRVLAEEAEPGRALVASCAGTTGAILGLLALGLVVHGNLVMAMPAPAGDGTLLIRRGEAPEPGALVLARDPASARLFLARRGPSGLVPEGRPPPGPASGWAPIGRAFFFLGTGARAGRTIS
jgi:hypothetical protein